jgi:hypothetical protein
MGQYIITIVPVETDDFSGPVAQTMVRVDTDSGRPSVREVNMLAPEGSSLVGGKLPYVDFEILLRAFVPEPGSTRSTSDTTPAVSAKAPAPQRTATPTEKPATPKATRNNRAAASQSTPRTSHLGTGRAYRRAPSLAELEAAYAETGSITGVANRFDVPVHTAQGWISRMRRKATAEG